MHDVPEQLRDWSTSLAQAVDPVDIDEIKSPMIPAGTISNNRRWLAVAASILVVAGGIVAIANLGSDDPDRISPATDPTSTDTDNTTATTPPTTSPSSEPAVALAPASNTPTTTTVPTTTTTAPAATSNPVDRLASWPAAPVGPFPANDIPRLLPTVSITPAGTPVRGEWDIGVVVPTVFTQVFADADRDILVTLSTQPNDTDSTPVEMRRPLTIDGWDDAFGTDGVLRLVASDPSGYVGLYGTGIDQDQAVAILASMQRRPDGIPGWDLAPQFDGLVEINGAWNDSAGQHFVTWFDGDRVVAQMLTSPAHTDLIHQALSAEFERVDVNGADGWLNSNDARRSIVWSPDGTTIAVLGVVDDRIDPLAVAVSVTELDAADYEARTTTEIPAGVGDGCDGDLFC